MIFVFIAITKTNAPVFLKRVSKSVMMVHSQTSISVSNLGKLGVYSTQGTHYSKPLTPYIIFIHEEPPLLVNISCLINITHHFALD